MIEGGRVNRISVAVLVDGTYSKNDKGEVVYQPRSKEEIDQIAALVRSAIGFDQKRGDQVEVVNLRFAEPPAEPIASADAAGFSALHFTKDDIMQAIEMVVMGLLALRGAADGGAAAGAAHPRAGRARTLPALPPSAPAARRRGGSRQRGAGHRRREPRAAFAAEQSETSKMIDIAQIQGQVHAQSVQKVGEIADRNPHETVSIIRQWLHESAAA